MTINIPQQFKNEKFRFVKLLPKLKKPFEKEWQKNGYKYDNEEFNSHLEIGNYGILLGHGNLICIDVDNRELISYFDEKCKDTLIIETGSGKRHVYYFCDVRKNKNIDGLGELRCNGVQTVGPGSIHPDTNKEYEILNDKPIKEISKEELDKIININSKDKSFIVGENLDKSRSGEEFWECVHKIEDGKSKEEIFKHMENKKFEKWNTHGKSYPSYREKTYTAALNFSNKNKGQVQENEGEIDDLKFWTIRDYEEYKPSKNYIIDQIMYPNDIEMIYGQSGHMKSLDILYRAVCIVSGRKYVGKFKIKKCPVAIISAENHKKVDKHRLKAIMRGLKIRKKDLPLYILPRENCGDLLDDDFKKGVEKFVKKKEIKVLIIDTINPVTPEVDDNKARDVTRVFNEFFKPLVDKYKINICFLHHTDKQARSFLGSTKFKANSDVTSLIDRKKIESYTITNEKNREGEVNGLEIGVEFINDKNGETKEIKFELIKEIEEKGMKRIKKKTKSNKIENKIMSVMSSTPKPRHKLIEECSEVGSKATIDRVLKKLVKDKKLNNSDEGYFLKE
jgi:hypothetical protein